MFGLIIISWWVFLIILIVALFVWFVREVFDTIIEFVEADKGERVGMIFCAVIAALFLLWLKYG